MRSPIGPVLVLLGVAITVVLVLVLFQTIGLRSELDRAKAELSELRAEVEAKETGVDDEQLVRRLDEMEAGIRDWLIATGADGFSPDGTPAGSGRPDDELLDRLDQILARVQALDDRLDDVCERVPVC